MHIKGAGTIDQLTYISINGHVKCLVVSGARKSILTGSN